MSRTISTRLSEDAIEELERIAEEEHLDRSALIRKLLLDDIDTYRKETALEQYEKGDLGVEQAAERAGVSLWEFVDLLARENVQGPPETTEELERELDASRERLSEA
jgi:predicted HTH domain antitoxin